MAWDSVPWFVGGGAQHSPEVGRLLAYTAFNGNEGILGALDLAVRATPVPGGSVTIAPGACSILSRASGGTYQAYAGRLATEDAVTIAPTSSGAGRSDLVVARVEDPYMAGEPWADPTDPTVGPYVFTRVISGVPSTTTTVAELGLGYSAIALARIDIPASTGTFTDGMITDLRHVANPRRERDLYALQLGTVYDLTSATYMAWPSAATHSIYVPSWATFVKIVATWAQVKYTSLNPYGVVQARLGSLNMAQTAYDMTASGGAYRTAFVNADAQAVPAAMRGTTQTLSLNGRRDSGSSNGSVTLDAASAVVIDYEFSEVASLL